MDDAKRPGSERRVPECDATMCGNDSTGPVMLCFPCSLYPIICLVEAKAIQKKLVS